MFPLSVSFLRGGPRVLGAAGFLEALDPDEASRRASSSILSNVRSSRSTVETTASAATGRRVHRRDINSHIVDPSVGV